MGSQYVHVSTDAGQTWTVISPDLTTNDKTKQQSSGGLSPDNTSVEFYCVLFAIAESPKDANVIWAGSNDGLVHVTRDGGKHWINVTTNFPNLPPWGTVSNIEPSRFDPGAAYVAIDLHQMNDRNPYVFRTADYGATWKLITSGIPRDMFSYAHCVREDPFRKGMLYLGTENAIYISWDNGDHWIPLQTNLPHAPVSWLTVQERFHDLVLATYGRGFWILDDISPLEQLTDEIRSSPQYLFELRPAYRFLMLGESRLPIYMGEEDDPPTNAGHNPPYGASINYYLRSAPNQDVQIEVSDKDGHLIRTIKGTKQAGINRVWWDLKYEPTKQPRLRTSPVGHPEIGLGPEGWRPFPLEGRLSPLVPPGTYIVKLKIGTVELSRPLVVNKDPNALGSEEGIEAQTKVVLQLRASVNEAVDLIDRAESMRKQIADIRVSLRDDPRWKGLAAEGDALDRKLLAIEEALFDPRITGSGDSFYFAPKLYTKLQNVARDMMQSDYQPTAAQHDAANHLAEDVSALQARFDALARTDIAAFNEHAKNANVPYVGSRIQ